MTICPCCGFKFEGNLLKGCESCGARAVGEPLPKPERELAAYGRPLLMLVTTSLLVLSFLVETVIALAQRAPLSFGFWSWISAGETASWRLKWIAIPAMFLAVWGGRLVYRSMMRTPARFAGMAMARRCLLTSAFLALLIATLIGVTIPARLEQRRIAFEAGVRAQTYTLPRALLDYQATYGSFPSDKESLRRLPDPGGSISAALALIKDEPLAYRPSATIAENSLKGARRTLPGGVLSNVSVATSADDTIDLALTDYELRMPGEDGIYGTDDDLIVRDGVIMTLSEAEESAKSAGATARARKR